MDMIADILLAAGALGAALYCIVLARRLKRFNNLETGVGGAVAVLSAQVDDMTRTLSKAQKAAMSSTGSLGELTVRAEEVAKRLELLVASMHDLPEVAGHGTAPPAAPAAAPPSAPPSPQNPAQTGTATPATQPQTQDQPPPHPAGPAQAEASADDLTKPLFLTARARVQEAAE